MKNKAINPGQVWKQFEDMLAPGLRLSLLDRAVYSHLFRHTWLEGKLRVRFSIPWLARGVRASASPTRQSVRRLIEHGALRLVERSKAGHVVEVRLPEEIRPARAEAIAVVAANGARTVNLEETDFLQSKALRNAIHERERGRCFYCMRRLSARMRCLDHVIPRVQMGRNSYRNLVSCCVECNSLKGERMGADFLRWLFREGKLTTVELKGRLQALEKLAAGNLRPVVTASTNTVERAGERQNQKRPRFRNQTWGTQAPPIFSLCHLPNACQKADPTKPSPEKWHKDPGLKTKPGAPCTQVQEKERGTILSAARSAILFWGEAPQRR